MSKSNWMFVASLLALSLTPATAQERGGGDRERRGRRDRGEMRERPRARGGEQDQQAADAVELPEEWMATLDWRSIGPANMSGRITSLAVYEADPCIWYAATASGGLLKTTNNGIDFEHQFDHEAVVSIGDVQVSQSDPDLVWVGTGESNPRNSVSWGNGVYKSTDGGKTWEHKGLEGTYQIGRMAIDPDDNNIVYVGALGRLWGPNEDRGLYKTTDGGDTWEKILYVDDMTGVIDVNMHPEDPNTLLVATYERQRDGFDTNDPEKKWGPGSAMWKSTDGGESFTKITTGLPNADLGRMDIEYYRSDPNVVYALVESSKIGQEPENAPYLGVRGEDADVGARLTEIIEGGPAEVAELQVGDIVVALDDETVQSYDDLIAKVRRHLAGETVAIEVSRERESVATELTFTKRPETEEDDPDEDGDGADNEGGEADDDSDDQSTESGDSEEAESDDDSEGDDDEAGDDADDDAEADDEEEEEEPPAPFRTGLGGQVPNVQEQQGPDGHEYGGLYKSTDGGDTWTRINSVNPRPMYFSQLRVDPSDDQHIYVLGISLYRSSDGGEEFTGDGGGGGVHVDHHAMWIDPNDGRHVILGNDGGIYVTYDRLDNWDHFNHVAIGQFYHVAVGPRRNYRVYGGLQDNGTWGGPNRVRNGSGALNEDWISIGGGDGFICRVDSTDPDLVYFESQNGAIGRRNLRTGDRGFLRARGERGTQLRWNWRTPFILSNHNTGIYYVAGNHVFRSWLHGDNLEQISPDITNTDRGSATALSESPFDAGVLYVGSDDGALWMTKNGGGEWTNLFGDEPAAEEEEDERDAGAIAVQTSEVVNGEQDEGDAGEAEDAGSKSPIHGTWNLSMEGFGGGGGGGGGAGRGGQGRRARRSDQGGGMSLQLEVDDEGKITGTLDTGRSTSSVEKGSFDAETGALSLEFGGFGATIEAKLSGETMAGMLSFGSRFEREFEATLAPAEGAPRADGYDWKTIAELVDKPMWVSSLEASAFEEGRVYVTLDGHRSDNDDPHVFVSEDFGAHWRSLTGSLPEGDGSSRVLREDLENPDILYLGTEFGAWVTIDRGASWTKMNNNLPTVAVHEFAQHPTCGEIVAGTHGRSLWVADVTFLRQITKDTVSANAHLYRPNTANDWRTEPRIGGTLRRFQGENPTTSAEIYYSLGRDAGQVRLRIKDLAGEVLSELDTSTEAGLHKARWGLRPGNSGGGGNRGRGRGGFGGGSRVAPGTYLVELTVGNETTTQPLVVEGDPDFPEAVLWGEEYERQMEIEELLQGEDETEKMKAPGIKVL